MELLPEVAPLVCIGFISRRNTVESGTEFMDGELIKFVPLRAPILPHDLIVVGESNL
jgi:hypothetical protein